jgi:hypothetical protein
MALTIEERVTHLEEAFAKWQQENQNASSSHTKKDWHNLLGTFDDDPEFEEILAHGRAYRASQQPEYDKPEQNQNSS